MASANRDELVTVESFEEARAQMRPICLRDGTAISNDIASLLGPGQAVIVPGGLQDSQAAAAEHMRTGVCDGFVQPLWMAQDMLVREANAPCDLRLVYPSIHSGSTG